MTDSAVLHNVRGGTCFTQPKWTLAPDESQLKRKLPKVGG